MTGLENGPANESIIIWSLAENKAVCNVSVPPQVAVIKLSYPDILACGHLDGLITTIRFTPTNTTKSILNQSPNTYRHTNRMYESYAHESSISQLKYMKREFRGHASAVISLEINQVRIL